MCFSRDRNRVRQGDPGPGDSPEGPFERRVSRSGTIENRRRYNLTDAKARYFVIWITDVSGSAHVNEVTAR